jgi:hypothetical protein
VNANDPTLQINDIVEVRRVLAAPAAVDYTEQATIKVIGCEKYVLRTTYMGLPGHKGDPGTVDDFVIEDLTTRFLGRLA